MSPALTAGGSLGVASLVDYLFAADRHSGPAIGLGLVVEHCLLIKSKCVENKIVFDQSSSAGGCLWMNDRSCRLGQETRSFIMVVDGWVKNRDSPNVALMRAALRSSPQGPLPFRRPRTVTESDLGNKGRDVETSA